MTRHCAIETCTNFLSGKARPSTIYCANCRASISYWDKMPLQRVILRRGKLKLYSTRVTKVITTKTKVKGREVKA